jgi:beta-phosphoglucomutase
MKKLMKNIEAVFLDFDGVILESVDVKGWAFGKLFEGYPEHVDEIVAFHHANGGMSRFDKIRHIYKEILREPLSEEKFEGLCRDFSGLVYERILACDFVPGALEFLRKYYKKFHLFIISSTPHEEINEIVDARGLRAYFKGVFGSPNSKSYWTKHVIKERKLDVNKVLFVGDALSDYRAAEDNNIRFVARIKDDNGIFKDKKVYGKARDLFELDNLLSEGKLE